MTPLFSSRVPAAPPKPDRDVFVWDIPGRKNAVVVEHTRSGYVVAGPLLFPDNPFASEWLGAITDGRAIEEARGHVVAVLTRRAEETMALANAFAAHEDEDHAKVCRRCLKGMTPTGRLCSACTEEIAAGGDDAEPDDDDTEMDRAEAAAAIALGKLRAAYADVVPVEGE